MVSDFFTLKNCCNKHAVHLSLLNQVGFLWHRFQEMNCWKEGSVAWKWPAKTPFDILYQLLVPAMLFESPCCQACVCLLFYSSARITEENEITFLVWFTFPNHFFHLVLIRALWGVYDHHCQLTDTERRLKEFFTLVLGQNVLIWWLPVFKGRGSHWPR